MQFENVSAHLEKAGKIYADTYHGLNITFLSLFSLGYLAGQLMLDGRQDSIDSILHFDTSENSLSFFQIDVSNVNRAQVSVYHLGQESVLRSTCKNLMQYWCHWRKNDCKKCQRRSWFLYKRSRHNVNPKQV